jgi:hypothetical protein
MELGALSFHPWKRRGCANLHSLMGIAELVRSMHTRHEFLVTPLVPDLDIKNHVRCHYFSPDPFV